MRRTVLDRVQTGLRWTLYGLTVAVYTAFAALIALVFGGFVYSFALGLFLG